MSLLISTYVPEGIILAGDSRLTLNWNEQEAGTNVEKHFSITATDTNTKVFLIKDKFGLGTFGAADINGIPIAGYINEFVEKKILDTTEIDSIPKFLHEFFGDSLGKPGTRFYLAGYKIENNISIPYVYLLDIKNSITTRINENNGVIEFGANWGGESEIMSRLLLEVKLNQNGTLVDLKPPAIPFNFFTLQDAIDFSNYAIKTTIETFKFQQRIKTVGGPVDILVITPNKVSWVQKKELNINP